MFGRRIFLVLNIFGFLAVALIAAAQTTSADPVAARRAALQSELTEVEKQIAFQTKLLFAKRQESASIERDVEILNYEIEQARLKIKAKRLEIERLGGDINRRENTITELGERIEQQKLSLAELLRKIRVAESTDLIEFWLADGTWSDLLQNGDSFIQVEQAIHASFERLRNNQTMVGEERDALARRRASEIDAQKAIESEQALIAKKEKEKQVLLAASRNQEKTYEQVLLERERRAVEIRTALFALRDTAAIPFGTALKYATAAFSKTGVRPAFLLAILTQESNLGENVGTCNRPTDPPEKRWRQIMKPERDHAPYLRLTQALGLNPDVLPLSCPWQGGWGGAMGPSQFIPSTWESMQAKVSVALGISTVPNPWEPEHAFMASAVFLKELGAAAGGYSAEREAALRYYAGGNWNNPKNAFYGNQVMEKARDIQENMINILQGI